MPDRRNRRSPIPAAQQKPSQAAGSIRVRQYGRPAAAVCGRYRRALRRIRSGRWSCISYASKLLVGCILRSGSAQLFCFIICVILPQVHRLPAQLPDNCGITARYLRIKHLLPLKTGAESSKMYSSCAATLAVFFRRNNNHVLSQKKECGKTRVKIKSSKGMCRHEDSCHQCRQFVP